VKYGAKRNKISYFSHISDKSWNNGGRELNCLLKLPSNLNMAATVYFRCMHSQFSRADHVTCCVSVSFSILQSVLNVHLLGRNNLEAYGTALAVHGSRSV
jgi:hypothetical protein